MIYDLWYTISDILIYLQYDIGYTHVYIYIYGWYTHVYECIHIIHDRAIDVFSLYIYISHQQFNRHPKLGHLQEAEGAKPRCAESFEKPSKSGDYAA